MVIYIDALIILNFFIDILLLITVKLTLKRNTSKLRILLAALFGEISILLLIVNYNYLILLISKILIAIIMNIITFKYSSLKYTLTNLSYFYMLSIILGGFLYFFYINNINYYFSLLIVPIIFIIYLYQTKIMHIKYQNYYEIIICFLNNRQIKTTGYLDTGNHLIDPITKKPVILIDKKLTKGVIQIRTPIYVSFNALNNHGLIKCLKPKYVELNNNRYQNVLIGIMDNKINMDGVGCILNPLLLEDKCLIK